MRCRFAHFVLILALVFALVGQSFVPAAMAMAPGHDSMSEMSTTSSAMCNGCLGMDHSKAMPSSCSIGVCSGIIAVLPDPASLESLPVRSYRSMAQNEAQGITVSPPLGPPRTLHFA